MFIGKRYQTAKDPAWYLSVSVRLRRERGVRRVFTGKRYQKIHDAEDPALYLLVSLRVCERERRESVFIKYQHIGR